MKIKTREFEIEIKAKGEYSEKMNKHDTQAFLNYISILAGEAENHYKFLGMYQLAKNADEFRHDIYEQLESQGYYGAV